LPKEGNGLSPIEIATRMVAMSDYEVIADQWVRRKARKQGVTFPSSIRITDVIDRCNLANGKTFDFLDAHLKSNWTTFAETTQAVRMSHEDLIKLVEDAKLTENRWRSFSFFAHAIALVEPNFIRPLLRDHLLPVFFKFYPEGRVVVMRYDTTLDSTASMMRVLYALAQAPKQELLKDNFEGVATLREWHMLSLAGLIPAILSFINYLFYPYVGGAYANVPGLAFEFLFDPPEKHMPGLFPRNWLAFASRSATFADEAVDITEIAKDPKGPVAQRAGHHRFCHEHGFSVEDRLKLLEWYVLRLNRLLFELSDAANFTQNLVPDAEIDPIFGYEHQITVDRLFRKTLLDMSLDVAPMANMMSFEIADLFDTLSVLLKNTKNETDFFKTLFNTKNAPETIGLRLASMPPPFAEYFSEMAKTTYQKIEDTVKKSIWRKGKVTPSGILVRSKDLTHELSVTLPDFVASTMRAYRNAHHGYFTAGDPVNRPSRFLFMVDGNLPVEMSALPVLWWLAYLNDPAFIGWNYLDIGAYP